MEWSQLTLPPIITVLGTNNFLGSFLMPEKDGEVNGMEDSCLQRGQELPIDCSFHLHGAPWWLQGRLTVVHGDHMQAVQELPLVFMNPLHLDIKHGGWVDLHFVLLLQELRELQLILLLRQCMGQSPPDLETLSVCF